MSVENEENRGLVVAAGGGKCLLPLCSEGTQKGKRCAAQAVARIAITSNPAIAFPGQRVSFHVIQDLQPAKATSVPCRCTVLDCSVHSRSSPPVIMNICAFVSSGAQSQLIPCVW